MNTLVLLHYRPEYVSCAMPHYSCMCAQAESTFITSPEGVILEFYINCLMLPSSSYFPSPPPHTSLLRLSNNQIKETPGSLGWGSEERAGLYCTACMCIHCCRWGINLWDSTLSDLQRVVSSQMGRREKERREVGGRGERERRQHLETGNRR